MDKEQTVICECCGTRISAANAVNDRICTECFNEYYITCSECGRVIHENNANYRNNDSDDPYCDSCFSRLCEAIMDYSYKPEPVFYGSGNLYMGVELEIDEGGDDEYNAEVLADIANMRCERIYIKRDGSLTHGFEIVTHPMTLEYHEHSMPWENICANAIRMGYLSHQTDTCGLHIHVNKTAFGDTAEECDEVIGRLVYFYEKFWSEILIFSRRTEASANRWASRYGGAVSTCKNSLDTAKKARLGRYTAVNLTNKNTIEFRIFRGTLRYRTIIAALQFTEYLCSLAIMKSDEEFHELTWSDFISGIDKAKYYELTDYLERRNLYCETEEA